MCALVLPGLPGGLELFLLSGCTIKKFDFAACLQLSGFSLQGRISLAVGGSQVGLWSRGVTALPWQREMGAWILPSTPGSWDMLMISSRGKPGWHLRRQGQSSAISYRVEKKPEPLARGCSAKVHPQGSSHSPHRATGGGSRVSGGG